MPQSKKDKQNTGKSQPSDLLRWSGEGVQSGKNKGIEVQRSSVDTACGQCVGRC